jgi:hypothetical protein
MKTIDIYTYPGGKADQYSQDTIVSFLQPNGRFTDIQVGELCDGDQYFIPEKELILSTDTEIIDFLVKNHSKIGWTIFDSSHKRISKVYSFRKEDLSNLTEQEFPTGDTPRLLGAFREMVTELMNNEEL